MRTAFGPFFVRGLYSWAVGDWRSSEKQTRWWRLQWRPRGPREAQADPLQAKLAEANRDSAAMRLRLDQAAAIITRPYSAA